MEYSKEDVEELAGTILNNWEDHSSQNRYKCNYCAGYPGAEHPTKEVDGYPHDLDCPVLIAQDVLTGGS